VTYGTFAETELGLFPVLNQVEEDFVAMAAVVGINTPCGPTRSPGWRS
jgi:hypothetical protein